jgi:transglutaminase-like putative cysteine protease
LLEIDRQPEASDARQYRAPSRLVPASADLADYAAPSFVAGRPLVDVAVDLASRIYQDFVYQPGFTSVTTPVLDVLHHRRGVCQDFAHLAVGCLRAMGLAARYVSGYIETVAPKGQPRLVGADASHAWFSVYLPGWGWIDVDPTNDQLVSESYVTTAWGRDYWDVSPLRGSVEGGGGSHTLEVAVDVTPVAEVSAG